MNRHSPLINCTITRKSKALLWMKAVNNGFVR
nr:MAG TPA_asm: hypothetical protein [Caudoviricetes sp.]